MADSLSVVVSGSIAIDRIMSFSGHWRDLIEPAKLHVLSVSVLVDSQEEAHGGTGANITHSLACLGERPVLVGSIGEDGDAYLKKLEHAGVDISRVHVSSKPSASFNVLTDSDNNQVGGFYPGAMSDSDLLSFVPWVGQETIVCISAHDPVAMHRQTKECKDCNIRLMYDPGQQVSNIAADDLRAGIDAAEILIVNEYELEVITKKTGIASEELEQKLPVFVVTHGEKGSVITSKNSGEKIPVSSVKPNQILDPTGAGDAYRAGFLYAYSKGWPLKTCGQLGSLLASFILEHRGTQTELLPSQITERYKSIFNEEINL